MKLFVNAIDLDNSYSWLNMQRVVFVRLARHLAVALQTRSTYFLGAQKEGVGRGFRAGRSAVRPPKKAREAQPPVRLLDLSLERRIRTFVIRESGRRWRRRSGDWRTDFFWMTFSYLMRKRKLSIDSLGLKLFVFVKCTWHGAPPESSRAGVADERETKETSGNLTRRGRRLRHFWRSRHTIRNLI